MKGEIETRLELGIQAAKAGELERACEILTYIIQLDQYNEQAWLWLSSVVETTADQRICLENVLFINPNNKHAAIGLQRLRQHLTDYLTSSPTLPSISSSQAPGVQEEEEDEWEWAGRVERESDKKWEWDASDTDTFTIPVGQECPRCDYRNPGWVYVCDRCGADLQPVDLRSALSSGAKPRGRSPITLLAAWGGALTFNRLLAFQPEVELASWGRSLSALVITPLFISIWRAVVAVVVVPQLMSRAGRPWRAIATPALQCIIETLPTALLLMLFCVPVVLLTWAGARLADGKQTFKTHTHLTIVAFSAWFILIALLASLPAFASQLPRDGGRIGLLIEGASTWIGWVVGLIGVIWLTQAMRAAHRLSAVHAILAGLLVTVLGGAILFGLDWFASEWLVKLVNGLSVPFSPWPG